jgi:OOP family OmpA-OmpF porin
MKSRIILLSAILGLSIGGVVQAKGYNGYVSSGSGELAHDSDGHCIYAGTWKPSDAIPQCDPDLVKKPAPKPVQKAVVKPAPPAPPKPVYRNFSLGAGALFDTNSARLKQQGIHQLDSLASKLKQSVSYDNIQVTGHTDSRGSARYNQGLSERRANAVRDYLISKGIAANKIWAIGKGESAPVADNKTAAGRQANRRVEIKVQVKRQVK